MAHSHLRMTHFNFFAARNRRGENVLHENLQVLYFKCFYYHCHINILKNPRDEETYMNCPNKDVPQKFKLC